MRSSVLCALFAVVLAVPPVVAQPPAKKDEPKLKVGDPAPPLTVGKWHQGPEVKAFEKDKVYVVVFWEAYRSESSRILREIDALHAKHKDIIPVAIGSGSEETGQGRDGDFGKREAEFVAKAKPKFTFAFASDKADATRKAYGANNDLALFVVGKDGKIEHIAFFGIETGRPELTDLLPDVLPKLLDGTWKGPQDADALAGAESEFQKALNYSARIREQGPDFLKLSPAKQGEIMSKIAAESLKAVDEFLKTHPSFAGQARTLLHRARMAGLSGQMEAAAKAMEAVIADGTARGTIRDITRLAGYIGIAYFEGQLSTEVPADKLIGTLIDVVMKMPTISDESSRYRDLMFTSIYVGVPDKGRALIDKMIASAPADKQAELKRGHTQQFEEQLKQFEAYLKERKKK